MSNFDLRGDKATPSEPNEEERKEPSATEIMAKIDAGLRRRKRAEKRFQSYGLISIGIALSFLAIMFGSIFFKGHSAFFQASIKLPVTFDAGTFEEAALFPGGVKSDEAFNSLDFDKVLRSSLRELFPNVVERRDLKALYKLLSDDAESDLRDALIANPTLVGKTVDIWLQCSADVDSLLKAKLKDQSAGQADSSSGEAAGPFAAGSVKGNEQTQQMIWVRSLEQDGRIARRFNVNLFRNGDSRQPESAGIFGALMGSFYTLLVTFVLSTVIGVSTAVYLEELAPKNRWTNLIEININNLAAVPSIVFGLLGLAVFISFFGLPRSAPLVGGLVLTLMTLPVIIIASRSALTSVPPSIRDAALGLGASRMQVVMHHVVPLALPGMLTGAIIGMARALGETAPLLMIGMVAFIVDVPKGFLDPATVLPVQIFLWSDLPERAFEERTAAAIIVLLGFMILMNGLTVVLRRLFERRW